MTRRIVRTGDDSWSAYHPHYDEQYHSHAGAQQEARLKYFEACRIPQVLKDRGSATILEIGYGLGINLIPIRRWLESHPDHQITYISTELDMDVFPFLLAEGEKIYPKEDVDFFRQLNQNQKFKSSQLDVVIHLGDARQTIQTLGDSSIDAIFHDPFSPYKNSECWTYDFFVEEKRMMKAGAILSTYTMSTPVRSGMYLAGLSVWDGVGDATKTTGTIATNGHVVGLNPLPEHMRAKLDASVERSPFRDPQFIWNTEQIKADRLTRKANQDYGITATG